MILDFSELFCVIETFWGYLGRILAVAACLFACFCWLLPCFALLFLSLCCFALLCLVELILNLNSSLPALVCLALSFYALLYFAWPCFALVCLALPCLALLHLAWPFFPFHCYSGFASLLVAFFSLVAHFFVFFTHLKLSCIFVSFLRFLE